MSHTTPSPALELARHLELLQLELQQRGLFSAAPVLKLDQSGFVDVSIDLSTAAIAGVGQMFPYRGFEVTFLRRVSTPGALLQIVVGGMSAPFAPGDKLDAHFENLVVKLAAGSVAAGTAVLRIALQPQAKFREFQGDTISVSPAALLGTISPTGVITPAALQLKDLVPSGAQAGAFNIGGWSTVLVLIDTTSNAGTATTFDLVPWYQTAGANATNVWFEQGTERVSVPDTNASGGQYRVVVLRLSRAQGNCYLAINNLVAAARTGLLMAVLGVN
jgi:hypothetical protein